MVINYSTRGPATIADVEALGWRVDVEASKQYDKGLVVTDGTYSVVIYVLDTHIELDRKLTSIALSLTDGLKMVSEFSDEYWKLPWMLDK